MKKLLLMICFFGLVYGADYSAMSTQELLAIMNYTVEKNDQEKILKELKSRVSEMSKKEKSIYLSNLKLLKSKNVKK